MFLIPIKFGTSNFSPYLILKVFFSDSCKNNLHVVLAHD